MLAKLLKRVSIGDDEVTVDVSISGLRGHLGVADAIERRHASQASHRITVPAQLKRCGRTNKLIVGDMDYLPDRIEPDPSLTKAAQRAHEWFARLTSSDAPSLEQIAAAEGVNRTYVARVVRLAFLAPDITDAILDGTQPPQLTAKSLLNRTSQLSLDWATQRRQLGFV